MRNSRTSLLRLFVGFLGWGYDFEKLKDILAKAGLWAFFGVGLRYVDNYYYFCTHNTDTLLTQ